jgi:hypothetical protein
VRTGVRILSAAAVLQLAAGCGGAYELPQGSEAVDLDPARFTGEIDNRYWPMTPGARWTYRETVSRSMHSSRAIRRRDHPCA